MTACAKKSGRTAWWLMLAVCIVVLAVFLGCVGMSPEQQNEALQVIDEMLKNGSITHAQWEAMREAILSASTTNWWATAAQTVLGAGLAYIGVQARRGPVATPAERQNRRAAARKPT